MYPSMEFVIFLVSYCGVLTPWSLAGEKCWLRVRRFKSQDKSIKVVSSAA